MLDQIPLQLDMEAEGIKEREDGERFGGGYYCKHSHQRGVFIQGRRLIEGRHAFLIKSYFFSMKSLHVKQFLCSNQDDKEGNKKIKSEQ